MAAQLAAHGWPALTRLLDRRALLDSVRAGNLGFMAGGRGKFFAIAEAVLIADDGPSARLEELLGRAAASANPAQRPCGRPRSPTRRWSRSAGPSPCGRPGMPLARPRRGRRGPRYGDEPGHRPEYALLLITPGPPPHQASQELAGLSARERELVTLVAQGLTNAQIAAELFISVRTVGSHLDRIRDKTGCRRRADLTRLALTAGLV